MDRIDQFEWDVKMLAKMAPYAAIQYIRKRIGYDDFLRDYAFSHNIPRTDLTDVIQEIAEAAKMCIRDRYMSESVPRRFCTPVILGRMCLPMSS